MRFRRPPPYFSQWGSLQANGRRMVDGADPSGAVDWRAQGFDSADEYLLWSDNSCGVACVQSILAGAGIDLPPKADLIAGLVDAGAYRRAGDAIVGLIYDPCVRWMRSHWDLHGVTHRQLSTGELVQHVRSGSVAIASVAKEIRSPAHTPTRRGGHLVLVFDADDTTVTLHNPSGLPAEAAADGVDSARAAVVAIDRFEECFAHRAMIFGLA